MANAEKLILTPDEIKVVLISIEETIESTSAMIADPNVPFNGLARKSLREILAAAQSVKAKFTAITGEFIMEPYVPGDEDQFLTKES